MANAVRQRTDRVRLTAYSVLSAVSSRDAYANLLLASALRDADLHGKDAALATELVYGTLRNRGCYDAIIGLCADRPHRPDRPGRPRRAAAWRASAARHADQIARRRRDHRRSGDRGGRAAALAASRTPCCAGSRRATSSPGSRSRLLTGRGPDRAPVGQVQPPALDRHRVRGRAGRRPDRCGGPGQPALSRPRPHSRPTPPARSCTWPTVPGLADPAELVASGAAARPGGRRSAPTSATVTRARSPPWRPAGPGSRTRPAS